MSSDSQQDRAGRLAQWIRSMDLSDQVFITGATLVLEDIRRRRGMMPVPYDESVLREGLAADAYRAARRISTAYAEQQPHFNHEGVDEHRQVSNLTEGIAERIGKYHHELRAGGR